MSYGRSQATRHGIASGLALALLVGCGGDDGDNAQPVTGGQPSVLPPAIAPGPVSQSLGPNQVAGEVFSPAGPHAGVGVSLWVQAPAYGRYVHVVTDAAGRFSAMGLENDSILFVKVIDDAYKQPCAASADADASEFVRVELFPLEAFDALEPPRPATTRDPSLTGTVYTMRDGKRTLLSGVHIRIESESGITIATALTGREGRYYLCNLPTRVVVGMDKPGYGPMTVRPVDTTLGVPLDLPLYPPDD